MPSISSWQRLVHRMELRAAVHCETLAVTFVLPAATERVTSSAVGN